MKSRQSDLKDNKEENKVNIYRTHRFLFNKNRGIEVSLKGV